MGTPPTVLTLLSSSPNTTTACRACVTRIVGHLSGHLLRSDSTLERLDSTCMPVGLFREWDCSTTECHLFPGDTLALYTDGVTESFNDAGEEFGQQRLVEALRRNRDLPLKTLMASILDE